MANGEGLAQPKMVSRVNVKIAFGNNLYLKQQDRFFQNQYPVRPFIVLISVLSIELSLSKGAAIFDWKHTASSIQEGENSDVFDIKIYGVLSPYLATMTLRD